jgi:hypothetical protein
LKFVDSRTAPTWVDELPVRAAGDGRGSGGGLDEAEEHPQGGGLACSVRSEESGDVALGDLEAEVVYCDDIPEAFGEAVDVDGGHGSHCAALTSGPHRP